MDGCVSQEKLKISLGPRPIGIPSNLKTLFIKVDSLRKCFLTQQIALQVDLLLEISSITSPLSKVMKVFS